MKLIHLLYGSEPYLIEEKKAHLLSEALSADEMEFGVSVHDMKETPLSAAVEDAQTLSFLGGKRVIILKDAYFLTTEKVKEKIEHDLDELIRYLEHPNEDTILIIMASSEKLDARKKIVKNLKKRASTFEGKPLKNSQLVDWIYNCSKELSVSISNEAINLLVASIGSNLLLLSEELTKMALYTGKNGEITKEVIDALMSRTLEQDIFKLIEGAITKNLGKAFDILDDMYRQGEDPIKIVNLLSRQIRIIFQTKTLLSQEKRESEIATMLRLHPYVVTIAGQQAKYYESNVLVSLLAELSTLDNQMKTGQVDKHLALETFLTKL